MDSFDNIKKEWLNQNSKSPLNDINLSHIIKKYTQNERNRRMKGLFLAFILIVVLVYLLVFAHFQLWTTYVGLSIFILISIYLIHVKLRKVNKVSSIELMDNNEFLSTLKSEESCMGSTKQQTNLFIFYAIGFGFYIYETASQDSTSLIIGYGTLVVYLVVAKFFYLPFMARREQKEKENIVNQLTTLQNQFKESS